MRYVRKFREGSEESSTQADRISKGSECIKITVHEKKVARRCKSDVAGEKSHRDLRDIAINRSQTVICSDISIPSTTDDNVPVNLEYY